MGWPAASRPIRRRVPSRRCPASAAATIDVQCWSGSSSRASAHPVKPIQRRRMPPRGWLATGLRREGRPPAGDAGDDGDRDGESWLQEAGNRSPRPRCVIRKRSGLRRGAWFTQRSARRLAFVPPLTAYAEWISPTWLNACGKFPKQRSVLAHLFREKAQIVGMAQRPVYQPDGPVDLVGEGKRLGQPEGAKQERSLVSPQPVAGDVTHDQPALVEQPSLHRFDGRQHLGVARREQTAYRDEEDGCIQFVRPNAWVKAPTSSSHPSSRIAVLILCASWRHSPARSAASRSVASSEARSSATQHSSFDDRKCRGSSRISQIP